MRRLLIAGLFSLALVACETVPEDAVEAASEAQNDEADILATWEQFQDFYNAGDVEGVKSLLYIEGLDEASQDQVASETAAMGGANAWMMSPNVGMELDADVEVRSVEGDAAILDGTLTQVNGQSVFFSMILTRVDGKWLLAPAGAPARS